MPTALINGANIYYESHGSGFPLVFAYGLGGNTGMWAGQVAAMSQRYRFIIWDPRGHGKSDSPPRPEQYGMQISAEDLRGLLDHLEIDWAYVGGLSMGGGIATRFAIAYPERVAALMIIDSASASGVPMSAAMRIMREKTIELCETQGMEEVADYAIETNPNLKTQAEASPEARTNLRRMFLALNRTGYANTIRAMLKTDFPTERLAEIKAPTLVMVGEKDPALEPARLTHSKIPGAQLVIIPDAGHLSNLDQPEEFNQHILTFLHHVESQTHKETSHANR
jgi:3-oxoadipate enol-lactonase